jgi:hypothetical protein
LVDFQEPRRERSREEEGGREVVRRGMGRKEGER